MEDIVSKNGELSRANSELRHKTTELQYQIKELRDKITSHKNHIDHLTRVRQKQDEALESMQVRMT